MDLFIEKPYPVGSKTLMEKKCRGLSSATIRNYFATLEDGGFLSQQHASGGRIPTELAYKTYAEEFLKAGVLDEGIDEKLKALANYEDKEVGAYLQRAAELLCDLSQFPVFLSSPRFDQDFIVDIKLVLIDSSRCLCVVLTELGLIHSEVLYFDVKLHHHGLKRIEEVLLSRIKSTESSMSLNHEEEQISQKIYNEVMVRFIIGYSNFSLEEVYTTGLSKLLPYPEFNSAERFASGLALFENSNHLRGLLKDSCKDKTLKAIIGSDLSEYSPLTQDCSVVTMPYSIGGKVVGAVGVLGPMRMPYRDLFGLLRVFSDYISKTLTQSMVKHKLTYRTPQDGKLYLQSGDDSTKALLEDKRN